jgi:drug/metabolite transporter (DMT)-like permease
MALVMLAALSMALLFLLFKAFDRRRVPLLPAIVINYFTACAWGVGITRPWETGIPQQLLLPALGLGVLFIAIFYLTGLSAQRAGVAATSVASKMSLVLTVLFAVVVFGDRPSVLGWLGIALALVAVPLASFTKGAPGARGVWLLPLMLFLGNAAIDIGLNGVQRELLTPPTEALFPTLVFAVAGSIGIVAIIAQRALPSFADPRAIIGGALLGSINYASLFFILGALARSGYAPSSLFPLMNIGVILFSTALGLIVLRDRISLKQWMGIALGVIALALIVLA